MRQSMGSYKSNILYRLTAFLSVLVLISWRSFDRIRFAFLWAEGGSSYVTGAYSHGISSLFITQGGYYNLFPRILALIAIQFPITWLPYLIAVTCVVVFSLIVSRFACSDYEWLVPSVKIRILACLGLTFMGGLHECIGNLCNLHWLLDFYLGLLAIRKLDKRISIYEIIFVFLIGGSGGESVVFIPVFLLRCWLIHRRKTQRGIFIRELLCVVCLLFWVIMNSLVQDSVPISTISVSNFIQATYYAVINNVLLQPLLGDHLTYYLGLKYDWAYWLLTIFVLWWISRHIKISKAPDLLLLSTILTFLFIAVMSWLVRGGDILGRFLSMGRGLNLSIERWGTWLSGISFLFMLTLLWRSPKKYQSTFTTVYIALYILLALYRFDIWSYDNSPDVTSSVGVSWRQTLSNHSSDCTGNVTIPIYPSGWSVIVPASEICKSLK